ncbi:hypothetical protein D9753_03740 [Streptomyces dangxiongensis]|uniref:Transposase n=1 Tax=Streptomyces dangxiongensis TaxID=1442032 RepID=A0A3G2J7H7_9ACTN|nr:hypothetical protein D9753_03740 [Streptomyces dangxiongensis]
MRSRVWLFRRPGRVGTVDRRDGPRRSYGRRVDCVRTAAAAGRARSHSDLRRLVNGVIWRFRTGGPCRDMPER